MTPASRLHLSLNFVGDVPRPADQIGHGKGRLAGRQGRHAAPFAVTLNQVESWKGELHPLVLLGDEGVIGVQLLHAAIHKALVAGTMAPRREPELWPHVSLLWDKAQPPREFVEPITWMAREFVLLDSPYGEGRHEVLGRWPLHD